MSLDAGLGKARYWQVVVTWLPG